MNAVTPTESPFEIPHVVPPESGRQFYVEFVWWDDRPGHFHISTDSLIETWERDEANVFFPRRWTKIVACDDIFTCDHS